MSRIIIASDIHNSHKDFYEIPNDKRMNMFLENIKAEYEKNPFDMILFLGDYSLDFWKYEDKGCYINKHVSYTKKFTEEIAAKLACPYYMIPGNHEQYENDIWKNITGIDRQFYVEYNNCVFIMLDTFANELDPTEHSDGSYSGVDVDYIKKVMEQNKGKLFLLMAHEFDTANESEAFKQLVREDDSIISLFAGHTHGAGNKPLGAEYGNKFLIRTGHYSFDAGADKQLTPFGFEELLFNGSEIKADYISYPQKYTAYGKEYQFGMQRLHEITLKR